MAVSDGRHRGAWDFLASRVTDSGAFGLAMAANNPLVKKDVYPDVESSVLPDPTRRHALSWGKVRGLVPTCDERKAFVNAEDVDSLLSVRNKKEFSELSEKIWPPRTKVDLSLRRSRLLDWVKYGRGNGQLYIVEKVLKESKEGWDLIWVTNLVVASCIFGEEWFDRWEWLGAFDGDLTHYIAVTKKVHDLGKSAGLADPNWTWYVECSTLGGYRNPPFPGFDPVEETRKLAEGGEEHRLFGNTWTGLVKEFLAMDFHRVEYIGFRDYVIGASWLTSGASSVGQVLIKTADGKEHRIKARKNQVADTYDLGQLADEALASVEQTNYTIIKSELGKLRLAVAGDIYTYLKQTWVNYLLGGAYHDWVGNTSEEGFVDQTLRLNKMLELCAKKFGLPYDYAGFDHQPQTSEIVGIVEHLCQHARLNVPREFHREFDSITANIVSGFANATLEVRTPGAETAKFQVTGGLMSGLRWTSVVGNAWNSVMTGLAMKLLSYWGIPTEGIERFIRGDDSAIFVDNWASGASMNLAYEAIGAKAGEGKFSLQDHQMEFLRVWFDQRCRGYPARAIPGLTQRKPWTSMPWSEDMVLRAQYEAFRTLLRRVEGRDKQLTQMWRSLRHVWCQNHSLPDAVTWTPIFKGGFGIESQPMGESWQISPPVPRATPTDDIHPVNQTSWRQDKIASYASERYGLDLGSRAADLAREELVGTLTADNIPTVSREVRQTWLERVRRAGCRAEKQKVEVRPFRLPFDLNYYSGGDIESLLSRLRSEAPLYGKYPEVEVARKDYDRFQPRTPFRQWLDSFFPGVASAVKRFHSSWHISERLDYLAGSLVLAPRQIHPSMVKVLGLCVASLMPPKRKSCRNMSLWAGGVIEQRVAESRLSQHLYWW